MNIFISDMCKIIKVPSNFKL